MLGRHEIATALVAPGKGILAADESIATMSKRLEAGIILKPNMIAPRPGSHQAAAAAEVAHRTLAGNCQRARAASSPVATPVRT